MFEYGKCADGVKFLLLYILDGMISKERKGGREERVL